MAHDIPRLLVKHHLHKHIAGIKLPGDLTTFPVLDEDPLLHRNQYIEDVFLHPHRLYALIQVGLHSILIARVGLYDIPAALVSSLHEKLGKSPFTPTYVPGIVSSEPSSAQDPGENPRQEKIDSPQIEGGAKRKKDDDQSRKPNLPPAGPRHLLQLGPGLPQETDSRDRTRNFFSHALPPVGTSKRRPGQ